MPATLSTQRLAMTPRSMADLEACLAMDRDPLVTQYIAGPWADPGDHRQFVLNRIRTQYPRGLGYWSVRLHGDSAFLGWILLIPYDAFAGEVEIGWRFTRATWGHGYAPEAAQAVLEHAFAERGLDEVVADIHPANIASIRVAEKIGMRYVGDRRVDGQPLKSYRAARPAHQAQA